MEVSPHDIYAPASEGPFRCDHCEYFKAPTTCTKPEIIRLRQGKVQAGACCDYFEKDTKATLDHLKRAARS